jgi:hemerythrin
VRGQQLEYIAWNESFSVKVPSLDEQHQQLVGYLNELHAMVLEPPQDSNGYEPILEKLTAYADQHFSHEERLMRRCGYPDYIEHKGMHGEFLTEVRKFEDQMREGSIVGQELLFFLQNWLISHIKGTDKEYSDLLVAHGIE